MIYGLDTRRAKVTQLEFLILQQYILNLDISMRYGWTLIVHVEYASAHIAHNVNNLGLTKSLPSKLDKQVK